MGNAARDIYSHSIFGEAYYRFVNLILREKLVVKEVLGFDMILDIGNKGLEKDLFLHGIRERESTEILSDYLEEGMNVVDSGANIGYYTLLEAGKVGSRGKVKAIEPTESTFRKLKRNCRLNGFENISLENMAAGSEKADVSLKKRNSPNLNRVSEEGSEDEDVSQDRLDNLVDFEPDVVRMDVQGYELEILKGMGKILDSDNLMLFLEVHPSKIEDYDGDIEEFWRILSEHGFKVKCLIRHPPRPKPSYFLRREYAPKKVLNPEMNVEETRKQYAEFFEWGSVFRIFLEKN